MIIPQPHVILADDDQLILFSINEFLISFGYRVSLACDGIEALEINEIDPANVIITDIRMPRLDGIGLIAEMRKSRPTIPVVVLTAYNDKFPPQDKYLTILFKPVSVELIELEIRRFLKSSDQLVA